MEDQTRSLSEVAGLMGVSERTVRRWIKSGRLKAYKPGRDYRIPESGLRAFIQESEISPKASAPPSPQPSFNDALKEDLEEERREREELAIGLIRHFTTRVEATEEELKAMSGVIPLNLVAPLLEPHLALRALYEEIASTRQPSTELHEAYEGLEFAISRVSGLAYQMMHPRSAELHQTRNVFTNRRAEILRDVVSSADRSARVEEVG